MNGVIDTPLQFAVGDGVTNSFRLAPADGTSIVSVLVANIFRQDWQGTQLLYTTPRTNIIRQSADMTVAPWQTSNGGASFLGAVTKSTAITAPDGTATPVNKLVVANNTNLVARNTHTSPVGQRTGSMWLYVPSGQPGVTGIRFNCDFGDVDQGSTTVITALDTWVLATSAVNITAARTWQDFNIQGITANLPVGTVFYMAYSQDVNGPSSSYIPTTTANVTVTDYSFDSGGLVTCAVPPLPGAQLGWTGTYIYTPAALPSNFPLNTIISQYSNSPTLVQLVQNFDQYIDPSADLDAFYALVWNVDTAVGFGLDNWGKIVGLPNGRKLQVASSELDLGFNEAGTASVTPFGSGVFYSGSTVTQVYALGDDAFRTLILVKALANISDCSIPSINQLLQNLFAGRGRCYVNDLGNMQMRYTFEFYMTPVELAIMTQSGALPRPTGVGATILQIQLPTVLGFAEAGTGSAAPFGQGTLFTGVLNAS